MVMWPQHTLPWAVDHLGYWHKMVLSVVESTPPLARLGHPALFSMSRVRCYALQYVLQTLSYLSKQCRVTDQLLNTGTTGLQQVLLFCSSFSSSHTQKNWLGMINMYSRRYECLKLDQFLNIHIIHYSSPLPKSLLIFPIT